MQDQDQGWRPAMVHTCRIRTAIEDMSRIKAGGLQNPPNTAACNGAHNTYTVPPPPTPHTVLHPLYTQCSPPPPHAKSEKKKIKARYIQVLKAINNNKNKIKKEKNTHACCLVKISTAIYNPDCLFVTRPLNCSHCLSLINVYLTALKNSVQTPTKTKYSHTHTKETCFFVIFLIFFKIPCAPKRPEVKLGVEVVVVEVPVVVALVPVPPEFGAHGLGSGSEFSRPCWALPAPENIKTLVLAQPFLYNWYYKFLSQLPCGTVVTGGMHNSLSLIQHLKSGATWQNQPKVWFWVTMVEFEMLAKLHTLTCL